MGAYAKIFKCYNCIFNNVRTYNISGFFTVLECGFINFKFLFNFCCYDNGSKYSMGICWINKFWNHGLYAALGGLAAVLVSVPPVKEAWQAGGLNMILCIYN